MTQLTDLQRAALADAEAIGLYRGRSAFHKGYGLNAYSGGHLASVVRPLIRRGLIRRPLYGERLHHITEAGKAALAGEPVPPPKKHIPPARLPEPAPIRAYKED